MPDQDKPGIVQAFADAMAEHEPTEDEMLAEAEQLPLLPRDIETDGAGRPVARKPGRPAGSKNRSTEWWARYLTTRFASPLVGLASVLNRPVVDLAKDLGCDRLEAMRVQLKAAELLLPYLHQKQPLAVQVDGKGVVQLVIAAPAPGEAVSMPDSGTVLDLEPVEGENDDKSRG